ncbi:MAG: nicotinamide-nucleotide amidohydrolase family protein [Cyanobacteria bacterium NC_groundwater_1444_Ag_S-0.65um_54_12]|nr:nicotinamide-nucleotide amidohydrolase family protein [Cyanobacteria bacterium NC_groundwater_1444_Ag_S-0.65um_54_12]
MPAIALSGCMKAELLSIGTEILNGQICDTNAVFLGQELVRNGIELQRITTLGDDVAKVAAALEQAWRQADMIICLGGLGAAPDNTTILAIAQFLGISASEPIPDPAGTTCGISIVREGRWLLAFPDAPHEFHSMWQDWAVPRIASLATTGSEFLQRFGHHYFGCADDTLPGVVGRLLRTAKATLATAESATGGLLASRITDSAGSSDYFAGGIVAYTVPQKIKLLGVSATLLAQYGHVSRETTEALARQVRQVLHTDWGIGITGYAGAAPGVPAERVGTMYVAIAGPADRASSQEFHFGSHSREQVKWLATQQALNLLRWQLLE